MHIGRVNNAERKDKFIEGNRMTENEKRLHRCCFTGHRPEKLNLSESQIKAKLRIKISKAISEGYTTFITGMAPGVDIWAAEIVLEKKSVISDIKLICALPYPEFCKRKDYDYNLRAKRIIEQADLVKEVCPSYNKSVFQKRNIWMVDHSNLVLAVYNGTPGGTKNTIDYAEKNGIKVRML